MARPLTRFMGKAMRGAVLCYQKALSPLIGPRCRYYPTCSAYMMTALRRFGPVRGLALGTARLLRCHPFSRCCLHDPVPERFAWGALFRYNRMTNPQTEPKTPTPEGREQDEQLPVRR